MLEVHSIHFLINWQSSTLTRQKHHVPCLMLKLQISTDSIGYFVTTANIQNPTLPWGSSPLLDRKPPWVTMALNIKHLKRVITCTSSKHFRYTFDFFGYWRMLFENHPRVQASCNSYFKSYRWWKLLLRTKTI